MLEFPKYTSYTRKNLRDFGFVMAVACGVIGGLSARHHGWRLEGLSPYWLAGAAVFALAGILLPAALRPFNHVWMSLAAVLGFVMTRVILSLAYFLVVTPLGLFLRLMGRDLLDMRWEKRPTYWRARRTAPPEHLLKQYGMGEEIPPGEGGK